MSLEWEVLDRLTRDGEIDKLAALLRQADERERLAFATEFETRINAISVEDWRHGRHNPVRGYALITIACLPSAARAAALLRLPDMQGGWGRIPVDHFLRIAEARSLPWLGDLGLRLTNRTVGFDDWLGQWLFVAVLLRAAGMDPPVTQGVILDWLHQMFRPNGTLVDPVNRLRKSPHLDLLLPSLFTIDGMGGILAQHLFSRQDGWQSTPLFPGAVAQLVAEGRLDRRQILDATVERLVRGDRPASLRLFALLHEALAPTTDELAGHALDYVRLLPDAPPTIAAIAQRALDDSGRLEVQAALEASRSVLVRKEKALVTAQLAWLDKIARREPDRAAEVMETVAAAFDHPALDIQERALTVIGRHLRRLDPRTATRLAGAATVLGGDLPARAATLFSAAAPEAEAAGGLAAPPAPVVTVPPLASPAAMPPPIAGPVELAQEVVALLREESGVRWERVLAGLVALRAAGETPALAEVLGPVLKRHADSFRDYGWHPRPRLIYLGEALRRAIAPERHSRAWQRMIAMLRTAREGSTATGHPLITTPEGVLTLRIAELSVEVTRTPMPELVATPTLVNGSLDAETLLHRLRRAESQGWQPWPTDFEQALLRVPREADATVLEQTRTLTSEAGRRFTEWLIGGGAPDPAGTRFEQRSADPPLVGETADRRAVVNLHPARAGGVLENHLMALEQRPEPDYSGPGLGDADGVLAMVLPHHREVVAAWALPVLARLADRDKHGGASLLPRLAECTGPIGPAVPLALAYVFGACQESDRAAGVDAFLALAASGTRFAATMGAEVGDLCADGTVKLNRVVLALTDAHRAGASAAVWEVLATAVPLLLPRTPRGLPDLLELATQVATATGAKAPIANLAEAAAKPGGSRLTREAKRLRAALGG